MWEMYTKKRQHFNKDYIKINDDNVEGNISRDNKDNTYLTE
jgi:hypothetical protein